MGPSASTRTQATPSGVQQARETSGEQGPAAYIEVKSIGGLNRDVNNALSARIMDVLSDRLGILGERVYITFQSIERDHWSWNGATFG